MLFKNVRVYGYGCVRASVHASIALRAINEIEVGKNRTQIASVSVVIVEWVGNQRTKCNIDEHIEATVYFNHKHARISHTHKHNHTFVSIKYHLELDFLHWK